MNICFIDFETTGNNIFLDTPIQLGAILVNHDLKVIKKFNSEMFLAKRVKISEKALSIHGLTHESLKLSPRRKSVVKSFFNTFGTDFCFAGWNISFDVPLMRKLCIEGQILDQYNKIDYHHIDVQSIVSYLRITKRLPQDIITLSDTISFFGLRRRKKHNALEDAILTFKVYKHLLKLRL